MEAILGRFGDILIQLLGPSWSYLGTVLGHLGIILAALGGSWAVLGRLLAALGRVLNLKISRDAILSTGVWVQKTPVSIFGCEGAPPCPAC